MKTLPHSTKLKKLIKNGKAIPLATQNYPSRGQTAVQELYQTEIGKLFLKRVNSRNHRECQIPVKSGTLAEREFWAFRLAAHLDLPVPPLALEDDMTTIQLWFNLPDAKQYKTSQGIMTLIPENVLDCALFDWISGQVDRHDANYLYNMATHQIILIDSGHAFLKYDGSMPDYLSLHEASHPRDIHKKIHTSLIDKLKTITPSMLRKLVPLRDDSEFTALENRLKQTQRISSIQELIALYRG